MTQDIFAFNGLVSRADLESAEWKCLFEKLEKEQADFLNHEHLFRSGGYKWPRDPLHTWSRLWEYPYVYHHIKAAWQLAHRRRLRVVDYGSGVTFFPFSVARLGCDVTCVDIDPVCANEIPAAAKNIQHGPGKIGVEILGDNRIPVETESQDIVYCISVLEHIPHFESVVDEIGRVLKPGGQLILTVDIDLRGNFELGANEFRHLQIKLEQHFKKRLEERSVHPRALLTTANSVYHMRDCSTTFAIKQLAKTILNRQLVLGDSRVGVWLAVYAGAFERRSMRGMD